MHGTLPKGKLARNVRQKMDGLKMLRALRPGLAKLVFLDPQYRAVMDYFQAGNEGKRQNRRFNLPQMDEATIALFVQQIERVLMPGGYLMLWTDKFTVGEGIHLRYFAKAPSLQRVDMGFWGRLRPGMGKRFRNSAEILIVAQKPPIRAKGTWSDHRMLDFWPEFSDRAKHPHAKPYQLTERLIRATTKIGDLVIDPCAGSYMVLDACNNTRRDFMGCDLVEVEQ